MDEKTKEILERYRLFWLIEKGEVPSIETSIPMGKNEKCYFVADANWCEVRSITRTARYGLSAERSGKDQIKRQTTHEFTKVDSGRIYLTNKRVLFYGNKLEQAIALTQVKDFVPMGNGIQIHRKSGNHPFLQFDLGVEVFSLMLARNLRDLAN